MSQPNRPDLLRARAPQLDLHAAVFSLEDLDDRHRVLEVEGSVDDDLALFFRALEDLFLAIGTLVQVDLTVPRRVFALRECKSRRHRPTQRTCDDPSPALVDAAATAHSVSLLFRKACLELTS